MRDLSDIEADLIDQERSLDYGMRNYLLLQRERQTEINRTFSQLHNLSENGEEIVKNYKEVKNLGKVRGQCKGCFYKKIAGKSVFIPVPECPRHGFDLVSQ
jgi:hypothetical protein